MSEPKNMAPNVPVSWKRQWVHNNRTPKYRQMRRMAKRLAFLITSGASNRELMAHMDQIDKAMGY